MKEIGQDSAQLVVQVVSWVLAASSVLDSSVVLGIERVLVLAHLVDWCMVVVIERVAVAADMGASLLVIANSIRLLRVDEVF